MAALFSWFGACVRAGAPSVGGSQLETGGGAVAASGRLAALCGLRTERGTFVGAVVRRRCCCWSAFDSCSGPSPGSSQQVAAAGSYRAARDGRLTEARGLMELARPRARSFGPADWTSSRIAILRSLARPGGSCSSHRGHLCRCGTWRSACVEQLWCRQMDTNTRDPRVGALRRVVPPFHWERVPGPCLGVEDHHLRARLRLLHRRHGSGVASCHACAALPCSHGCHGGRSRPPIRVSLTYLRRCRVWMCPYGRVGPSHPVGGSRAVCVGLPVVSASCRTCLPLPRRCRSRVRILSVDCLLACRCDVLADVVIAPG